MTSHKDQRYLLPDDFPSAGQPKFSNILPTSFLAELLQFLTDMHIPYLQMHALENGQIPLISNAPCPTNGTVNAQWVERRAQKRRWMRLEGEAG